MDKFLSVIFWFLLTMQNVFADEVPAGEALSLQVKDFVKQGVQTPSWFHVAGALLLVIALIYVTGWLYSKLSGINSIKFSKTDKELMNLNKFKIISTLALGQHRNLHVVEVNGKFMVIGATAQNISILKEFDKNDLMNQIKNIDDDTVEQNEEVKNLDEQLAVIYPEKQVTPVVPEEPQVEDAVLEDIYRKYL